MKVLYFGVYDPGYARNWVLINGLKKNGVEIVEIKRKPSRINYIKLIWDYIKLRPKFDVMVVGFPGQEIMFFARLLTSKPIVFDCFTSHYGGYILDRKKGSKNSLKAKYYKFLDKWSCKLANIALLDTQAHINFFIKEFGLKSEKFRRIWIGANDDNFYPIEGSKSDVFRVIFFGTYVPLQGAEYVIKAAKILEHEDIKFILIGKGQDKTKVQNLAEELGLKNVEFKDMVEISKLRFEIADSDVSLGLFGNTPKTPLVIPNKVYEALAMQKPVITSDTEAIRELFTEKDIILVEPANSQSLADAILKLKNDPDLRKKIVQSGHDKFVKYASSKVLGQTLKDILINQIK